MNWSYCSTKTQANGVIKIVCGLFLFKIWYGCTLYIFLNIIHDQFDYFNIERLVLYRRPGVGCSAFTTRLDHPPQPRAIGARRQGNMLLHMSWCWYMTCIASCISLYIYTHIHTYMHTYIYIYISNILAIKSYKWTPLPVKPWYSGAN